VKLLPAIVGTLVLVMATSADAIPVKFDIASNSTVDLEYDCLGFGCGAYAAVNPNLDYESEWLSVGDTWSFDFFSIRFDGIGIGWGSLSAALRFDAPVGGPAVGVGTGWFTTIGILSGGNLSWTQPDNIYLADGTSFSVMFDDLHGIARGQRATVRAHLTLNTEPGAVGVSVPEPGMLGLFGLGLLGVAFGARRRSRVRAA
jgi:hypothetical protein